MCSKQCGVFRYKCLSIVEQMLSKDRLQIIYVSHLNGGGLGLDDIYRFAYKLTIKQMATLAIHSDSQWWICISVMHGVGNPFSHPPLTS